jgi:D-ribulokinase
LTSRCYLGVDVGTGSARVGVFDATGIVEQSSATIWQAVAASVHAALAEAGVAPRDVAGIGFAATCSLVVLGPGGRPLPVGPSGDPGRNVVVWMDHCALDQAERITRSVLRPLPSSKP